jgi:5-dehydro-2-deoxygluconokinase
VTTTHPLDTLVIGRSGVDIYPLQVGVGLEDVTSFGKFLGGTAANVAVATARLGHTVALISGVGDDPFGRFCEIFPPDDFPLYFYRKPTAPDLQVRPEDIDHDAVQTARLYWSTVTGLCEEPSRSAHFAAWELRERRRLTVLDLDWRPMFWESAETAGEHIRKALSKVTVAVGTREECEVAVGESDPMRAADALLDLGIELAIVKRGPKGVLGRTRTGTVTVPPIPVEVVNGLGAGDGFGGSLCHGLLEGWRLEKTLRYANAAGAIVASRLECSTAMPTAAEVANLAEAQPRSEAINA